MPYYEACSNETHSGVAVGKEAINIVPVDAEAGIPFMQQLMDHLCKELPGLLLEPLHHHSHVVFVQSKYILLVLS
jgi:hypothetical protein